MTDEEWGPWIGWAQGPMPVKASVLVQVQMGNGEYLTPMRACDIDWDYPGDPVIRYRIRKPRGMKMLEELLQNLPEDVDA